MDNHRPGGVVPILIAMPKIVLSLQTSLVLIFVDELMQGTRLDARDDGKSSEHEVNKE